MNREERFFTATILPALLGADGFSHLHRFGRLIEAAKGTQQGPGSTPDLQIPAGGTEGFQFFTEYNTYKARYATEAKKLLPGVPPNGAVPDVLICRATVPPFLLAIEAKMYLAFTPKQLGMQMTEQLTMLSYLQDHLQTSSDHPDGWQVHQVAVVPQGSLEANAAGSAQEFQWPIVTWEAIRDAFADVVSARYWWTILDHALKNFSSLVSQGSPSGQNSLKKIAGATIVEEWLGMGITLDDAASSPVRFVGCQGGLDGSRLNDLMESGNWRTQAFEVSIAPSKPEGKNWFPVEAFVEKVLHGWVRKVQFPKS